MLNDVLLNAAFMLLGLITSYIIERPKLRKSEAENTQLREQLSRLQDGISQTHQDLLGRQGIPTTSTKSRPTKAGSDADIAEHVLLHARRRQDSSGRVKIVDLKASLLDDGYDLTSVETAFDTLVASGQFRRFGNVLEVIL